MRLPNEPDPEPTDKPDVFVTWARRNRGVLIRLSAEYRQRVGTPERELLNPILSNH